MLHTQLQNKKTPSFSKSRGQTKESTLQAFSTACQHAKALLDVNRFPSGSRLQSIFTFFVLQPAVPFMGNVNQDLNPRPRENTGKQLLERLWRGHLEDKGQRKRGKSSLLVHVVSFDMT